MAPSPLKKGKTPEYISLGNNTMSGSGTFSYKVKLKPMPKHTNLPNEIETKPNTDRTNNIIIGIAMGVMISACGVIYLLGITTEILTK